MKILIAPVNIAGQPIQIVNELRNMGVDATLMQYVASGKNYLEYDSDKIVRLAPNRTRAQLRTLRECLEKNFDIYHFWLRTLFYGNRYEDLLGFDLPFIKLRNKKVIYRFTGYDLRTRSDDMTKNPYSAFRYGLDLGFDEKMQKRYIDFLREYVDEFIVQDPEMQSFFPEAHIVPRVIDLNRFPFAGVDKTDWPLVVHAPTSPKIKGTAYINRAVEHLRRSGLKFHYKPITRMKHEEAVAWYRKSDIVIDQLHIGWYGVLTIEAMALGKPVIVYIRDELIENFEHDIPFQNANPDNIEKKLRELLTDFEKRKALAKQGRSYVEAVHDVKKVVSELAGIYRRTLTSKNKEPHGCSDIEFFAAQLDGINNNFGYKWSRRINNFLHMKNAKAPVTGFCRRLAKKVRFSRKNTG